VPTDVAGVKLSTGTREKVGVGGVGARLFVPTENGGEVGWLSPEL